MSELLVGDRSTDTAIITIAQRLRTIEEAQQRAAEARIAAERALHEARDIEQRLSAEFEQMQREHEAAREARVRALTAAIEDARRAETAARERREALEAELALIAGANGRAAVATDTVAADPVADQRAADAARRVAERRAADAVRRATG